MVPGFWLDYIPHLFALLSNSHVASVEGLDFLHLIGENQKSYVSHFAVNPQAQHPHFNQTHSKSTFYSSVLTLSWREDCLYYYLANDDWRL